MEMEAESVRIAREKAVGNDTLHIGTGNGKAAHVRIAEHKVHVVTRERPLEKRPEELHPAGNALARRSRVYEVCQMARSHPFITTKRAVR